MQLQGAAVQRVDTGAQEGFWRGYGRWLRARVGQAVGSVWGMQPRERRLRMRM